MSNTNLIRFSSSLAIAVFCAASAFAQSTTRVSVNAHGVEGNKRSTTPAVSFDGRYVAFESLASNLVPGDTNRKYDTYVYDRQTGQTTRVSVDSAGVQGDGNSYSPAISADGRYVAFASQSTNLVPGDTNRGFDVFVHDRQTGQTTRVSVDSAGLQGNSGSSECTISADGRLVAFVSFASNLVPGDTHGTRDVFVHDRQTDQTTLVSVDSAGVHANDDAFGSKISADGRSVAFLSHADNLVPGDTNNDYDTFVHDRQIGQTTRVSVDSAGAQGEDGSYECAISSDGRFVAFESNANNFASVYHNVTNIFVHDLQTGQTTLVSVNSAGSPDDSSSINPAISADGRFVAFESYANNLVAGDTNVALDVFVHDRQTGQTTRASVHSSGAQGNDVSYRPALSGDGRFVAFDSEAFNLVPNDTNSRSDIFIHDREGARVSLTKTGTCPGALDVTVLDATPNGPVAILFGPAGSFVKVNPPCKGMTVSLDPPTLLSLLIADAAGGLHFMTYAPPQVCGLTAQVVDLTTCTASNPVVL